eukprot:CAMPEP_0201502448 /NCGR_PEP_ID=MMETSP0151_2-20130828/84138_1 /ASSEMBLY_ACC=CAM_ASM_000257 /TAXON_ID=200890 /ORGANISM="Paramoeba atlantica, Strain 621/1 / CCAP 1560/9" /LENGTH=425 /DNA_ID=CAMNT_0047896041 /DNA_START=746 /DNA_END=2019 /DNA_ORIENTATION=-
MEYVNNQTIRVLSIWVEQFQDLPDSAVWELVSIVKDATVSVSGSFQVFEKLTKEDLTEKEDASLQRNIRVFQFSHKDSNMNVEDSMLHDQTTAQDEYSLLIERLHITAFETPQSGSKASGWRGAQPKSKKEEDDSSSLEESGGGGDSQKDCFLLRGRNANGIEKVAHQLRFLALCLHSLIRPRNFLRFCASVSDRNLSEPIATVLKFERYLTKWIFHEIAERFDGLNPPDPPPSLQSYNAFSDLATESYKIGDLSSCIAIVETLMSDSIMKKHLYWSRFSSHRTIRCKFESSIPYKYFHVSASLNSSDYLKNYEDGIESIRQSGHPYLTNIGHCINALDALPSVLAADPSGGRPSLNLMCSLASYNIIQKLGVQGMYRGSGKICEWLKNPFEQSIFDALVNQRFPWVVKILMEYDQYLCSYHPEA